MKKRLNQKITITFMFLSINLLALSQKQTRGLKDVFKGKFYIGTAMNTEQILGTDTAAVRVIKQHFNCITAENCMKCGLLQPVEGKFDFALADKFVEFGMQNKMFIVGHNLAWHSQAPRWYYTDENGKEVSREVMINRIKTHIQTVVGRYKGKVKGWDVVNEAIMDDGSWRESKLYKIIGPDFLKLAFKFAHEADPNAELYYNDYSMALPGRREGVVKMVKDFQKDGIRIDGIGMQCHVGMDYPKIEEFEKSILAFAALGVKVMITEMDISALPSPETNQGADVNSRNDYKAKLNPYVNGLPDDVEKAHAKRYKEFFALFLKHQDKISRVTTWGVNDGQSWKNNFPIAGRTDYPLLFDRKYQPKSFVKSLLSDGLSAVTK